MGTKMRQLHRLIGIFCILVIVEDQVQADRTSNKIYINIKGTSACFRRMNATHQIGCASVRGGNVGVLHYINAPEDITWLKEEAPNPPYAALVSPTMFTDMTVQKLLDTGKVNSMLVIFTNSTNKPDYFSADETCPNDRYGIYAGDEEYANCKKATWNPHGTGFMFKDFPFPIMVLTNETEVDILITQCYERFNKPGPNGEARQYPLCSAQVKDEMDAAKDTPTCIRRSNLQQGLQQEKYCDPLGNHNTFAFTRPITFDNPATDNSIIVAAARLDGGTMFGGRAESEEKLDGFSLFNEIYTNAEGTVSGIVTLLGAAFAIGKHTLPADHKPIMFAFFNGEAYDYIGSSRIVYEMEKGTFPTSQKERPANKDMASPIKLENIHSFVEVSQVGKPLSDGEIWIHRDPLSIDVKSQVDQLVSTLQQAGTNTDLNMRPVGGDQPLPSASLQSFLKKKKIPGVVIADHQTNFTNEFYNSRFDLPSVMNAEYPKDLPENKTYDYVTKGSAHLQKVATTLARALYTMSTGSNDTDHISVDNTTMANLLNCYLHAGDCELFYQLEEPGRALSKNALSYYVGVSASYIGPQNVTRYTERALAFFLGDHLNVSRSNCSAMKKNDDIYTYLYAGGPLDYGGKRTGLCLRSTANTSLARSPAFDIDGYNWDSAQYSSWSESQWQNDAMSVRVFLVPSRQREIAILVGGLGFALLATLVVYFIKLKGRSLFDVAP